VRKCLSNRSLWPAHGSAAAERFKTGRGSAMRMLKILTVVAFVVFIILVLSNGPRQRAPAYNVATEVSVQGVVQEVQQFWCPINGDEGTHLMLSTDSGVLQVHVAPRRFLSGNGLSFRKGEQIDVVGSIVIYQGHDALIARKITRDNQTIAVRAPNGKPLWVE